MEHLLNLLWLVVSISLFATVVRASRTGALRCSFGMALGCTALLAIFLFPAISMTDDLQRAKLDAETAGRSNMQMALLDGTQHLDMQAVLMPLLLLLTLFAGKLIAAHAMTLSSVDWGLRELLRAFRPRAVRPPPAVRFA